MKRIFFLLIILANILIVRGVEVPNIMKEEIKNGKKIYIFNNTQIKTYDLVNLPKENHEKFFQAFVNLLPISTPLVDIPKIIRQGNYKAMPSFRETQNLLFRYDSLPNLIGLNGSLMKQTDGFGKMNDSVLISHTSFSYNGNRYSKVQREIHYKTCVARIELNPLFYTLLIYNIGGEGRVAYLNNYTKSGNLLSSIEVFFSEEPYNKPHVDINDFYLRTVIDNNGRIHRIFQGGAATSEKYTYSLDESGYFKIEKIQVYDWDSSVTELNTISIDEVINFTKGEILKAFINDPDGYTNVREQPNSSSPILYKIKKDESFYVITDLINDNWYKIALYENKTKSYEGGYIHKSKIKIIPK
ncbi:MAG: SH3 domain-containing protein [Prevotellaceae bacterium]|jgi:hypothetical protein|nr:SH3 domain-containing protein [Prevotellaceae bacterium]